MSEEDEEDLKSRADRLIDEFSKLEDAYEDKFAKLTRSVSHLCDAIGGAGKLSPQEAYIVAVNTRLRLDKLEDGFDLTAVTDSDLLDEVARRMALL